VPAFVILLSVAVLMVGFSTPSRRCVNKALLHRLVGLGCLRSSFLIAFSTLSDRIRSSSGVDVATIALPRFHPADFSDLGGAFGYPRNFSGLTNVEKCSLVDGTAAMVGDGRLGAETEFPMSAAGKLVDDEVGNATLFG
jgi:hypothetical protein